MLRARWPTGQCDPGTAVPAPAPAVQELFEDVNARLLAPMHWGTFDLNREPFGEPPARLLAAALRRGIEDRVALLAPGESIHW